MTNFHPLDYQETLRVLLDMSRASATVENIWVEQEHGTFRLRPNLHVIMLGNIGISKSTILNAIAQQHKTQVIKTFTEASILGSIDDRSMFVPSALWMHRNKPVCFDELVFDERGHMLRVMNGVMEHEPFAKVLGRSSLIPFKQGSKTGGNWIHVRNNLIEGRVKIAFIGASMYGDQIPKNLDTCALFSRMIPFYFVFPGKVIEQIEQGKRIYSAEKPLVSQKEYRVGLDDYKHIREIVKKFIDVNDSYNAWKTDVYLRTLGDCIRAFCLHGQGKQHNESLYQTICLLKMFMGKRTHDDRFRAMSVAEIMEKISTEVGFNIHTLKTEYDSIDVKK